MTFSILQPVFRLFSHIPKQAYLWFAILIFGASSAITRKLSEIGSQHFVGGHNPISLCNVLFVGNLCALLVLCIIYREQLNGATIKQRSRSEWVGLVGVALLAGALAPGLIFQALSQTPVNTVVLVGRLEPPLTLALSVFYLGERVNRWEALGAIVAFLGVVLTVSLQPASGHAMGMGPFVMGVGELLVVAGTCALAIATIIGKKLLSKVPLGFYSIFRTGLGTLVFFCLALILYGHDHFMEVLSPFLWQWMLLYGAIIVVVGQSFWLKGLRLSTISTASLIASFTPIAGILSAYFILGEVPTLAQYLGGSVILGGIILSHIGLRRQKSRLDSIPPDSSMKTEAMVETQVGFKGI